MHLSIQTYILCLYFSEVSPLGLPPPTFSPLPYADPRDFQPHNSQQLQLFNQVSFIKDYYILERGMHKGDKECFNIFLKMFIL